MKSTGTVLDQSYLRFSNLKKRFPEPKKVSGTFISVAGAYNRLEEEVGADFASDVKVGDYLYIESAEVVRKVVEVQPNSSPPTITINQPVVNTVVDFIPANVEIGDIFTIIMPDKSTVSFTATVATVANVTAGLFTAWTALTVGVFSGFTPLDNTTSFRITSKAPWEAVNPYTIKTATVDGGGADTQTLTVSIIDNGGITSENIWIFPDEVYRSWSILNIDPAVDITLSTAVGDKQVISSGQFVELDDVDAFAPLVVDGTGSVFTFLSKAPM